jgi:nucleoside-diphosphate-sugar epimerase
MRVAVTGATGFVGRHVWTALRQRGVDTVCLGRRPPEAVADFVACDLDQPASGVYARAGRPDRLIHLAWGGLPQYGSVAHVEHELPLQRRFLRTLLDDGLPRLLVTGTCFEYGLQTGALREDAPLQPVTQYGLAKARLLDALQAWQATDGFSFCWARLFYTWGDGQPERALWPLLQSAAERGDAEFPMSGGEQLRDYLPIDTLAGLLVDLALDDAATGIVNVCSGRPVSVRKLVGGWIREHGWTIRPALGCYPYAEHEPMAFWGDRSRLDAILSTAATNH